MEKAETNIDKINKAIEKGAKPVKLTFWNSVEYGLQYNEGGYFRITKRMYDKLTA